jgi:hypothetical protein
VSDLSESLDAGLWMASRDALGDAGAPPPAPPLVAPLSPPLRLVASPGTPLRHGHQPVASNSPAPRLRSPPPESPRLSGAEATFAKHLRCPAVVGPGTPFQSFLLSKFSRSLAPDAALGAPVFFGSPRPSSLRVSLPSRWKTSSFSFSALVRSAPPSPRSATPSFGSRSRALPWLSFLSPPARAIVRVSV